MLSASFGQRTTGPCLENIFISFSLLNVPGMSDRLKRAGLLHFQCLILDGSV